MARDRREEVHISGNFGTLDVAMAMRRLTYLILLVSQRRSHTMYNGRSDDEMMGDSRTASAAGRSMTARYRVTQRSCGGSRRYNGCYYRRWCCQGMCSCRTL